MFCQAFFYVFLQREVINVIKVELLDVFTFSGQDIISHLSFFSPWHLQNWTVFVFLTGSLRYCPRTTLTSGTPDYNFETNILVALMKVCSLCSLERWKTFNQRVASLASFSFIHVDSSNPPGVCSSMSEITDDSQRVLQSRISRICPSCS